MKMWNPIVTFISLLMSVYLIFFIYKIDTEVERQFDEQRLRYAVDYATEAGFRAALSSDDLGIDYTDMTDVKISPTSALETFESLMCISYDMPISEVNLAYIESFMPTAVVVCNDGYYVAKTTESDTQLGDKPNKYSDDSGSVSYGLNWGMKIPFSVAINSNDDPLKNDYVAFSLQGDPLYKVTYTGDTILSMILESGDKATYNGYFTKAMLNERLNKEVNLAVRTRNENFTPADGNISLFYVPSEFSTVTNNAITGPTFITMLQNVDFAGSQRLDVISVGGTKVEQKKLVIAFVADGSTACQGAGLISGQSYYCYSDKLPSSLAYLGKAYYESTDAAAKKGYLPAITLMHDTD